MAIGQELGTGTTCRRKKKRRRMKREGIYNLPIREEGRAVWIKKED